MEQVSKYCIFTLRALSTSVPIPLCFILLISFHRLTLQIAYLRTITGPVWYPTAFGRLGIRVLSHTDACPITATISSLCWTCMISHSTIFATHYK